MADYPKGQINRDFKGNLESVQYSFAGMNFLTDPADITIESGQCVNLQNCDIDYAYNASRRNGSTQIYNQPTHSLWNGDSYTYCVVDGFLSKFLWGTLDVELILTPQAVSISVLDTVEFKQVNDVVYYTDGVTCGVIVDNIATALTAVTLPTEAELVSFVKSKYPNDYDKLTANFEVDTFKVTTTPGTCPEYYNGVLYYAIDNFLYCTKAFDLESEDIRYNVVAGFPHDITMVARVNDGLYVSTTKHIYFLAGTGLEGDAEGNLKPNFSQRQVAQYGVVKGSNVRVNATLVPDAQAQDTIVLCSTLIGIFALCNGGRYVNLSASQIAMPSGTSATALLKEDNNLYQYIVCYNVGDSLYGTAPYTLNTANCIDTIILNTINLCHSKYTNYAFNSLIRYGNSYYGSCMKGIYRLTGDKDYSGETDTLDIVSKIVSPVSDFNDRLLKQASDAFIHSRQSDDMTLTVIVNETDVYDGFLFYYDDISGIHRRRVKLPRGLKGADWQFILENINGCSFTVFDLELFIKTLKRNI